jgi:deferrochelatase/peroxidase EfeB
VTKSVKVQIDLSGIQAVVADLYRCRISRHLIFHVGAAEGGQAFIGNLAAHITMAEVQLDVAPEPFLNIGVSFSGLRALGVAPALLEDLDTAFKSGPDARALGDVPSSRSDPTQWWEGQFSTEDIHCIVHIYVQSDEAAKDATEMVRDLARRFSLAELIPRRDGTILEARSLGGAKLHFGYTDGISHPDICWNDAAITLAQVDFRMFLLGYSTPEYPSAPGDGATADLVCGSTYGVFRWLYQDVAAFNSFLSTQAPKLFPNLAPADAEELLAAKMMGRWRDGTPLVLSPDAPDSELSRRNDFGYATQDPDGHRCPFSAHIRVVNPRDTALDPIVEGVPLVLRRGMPYGPALGGSEDDGVDRGIVGIFLCADLRRQFYMLTDWANKNDFSPVYDANRRTQDPLIGNRAVRGASTEFFVPGASGGVDIKGLPDFVHTKGTVFLLYPSKATLAVLSTMA